MKTIYRVLVLDKEDNSEVIVEESSYYLLDQQGNMHYQNPFDGVRHMEDKEGVETIPLFKIKEKWMSISDIEAMIDSFTWLGLK